MATHALLAVQSATQVRRQVAPPTCTAAAAAAAAAAAEDDDAATTRTTTSSSGSINSASLGLRHRYSIASTSSTLYTYDEEDEEEEGDTMACDEVILDPRLNNNSGGSLKGKGSAGNSSRNHDNHAMRFKRRSKPSRKSLVTLGEEWLPSTMDTSPAASPSTSTTRDAMHMYSGTPSPSRKSLRKQVQVSPVKSITRLAIQPSSIHLPCTCGALASTDASPEPGGSQEEEEGYYDESITTSVADVDEQLDKMIRMTSDLLRVSKGVLASSKRIAVAEASLSHTQHSHEHALRQHIEALETQDRFMYFMSSEVNAILNSSTRDHTYNPLHSSASFSANQGNDAFEIPTAVTAAGSGPPGASRTRLRPHASNGSISALPMRATTMYINAEAGASRDALPPAPQGRHDGAGSRDRNASITSHATSDSSGAAGLNSSDRPQAVHHHGDEDAQFASTPAQQTTRRERGAAQALSQLSNLSLQSNSTSSSDVAARQAAALNSSHSNSAAPAAASASTSTSISTSLVSPGLASEASSSTPSTFFSSFWSRSSAASSAPSSHYQASPKTSTSAESSPSLSRLLGGKSASQARHSRVMSASPMPKKDAKGMLSALAHYASSDARASPTLSSSTASSPLVASEDSGQIASFPDSETLFAPYASSHADEDQLATVDPSLVRSRGPSLASPPLPPTSIASTASAQVSAVHSSPHLTVSSRIRHRASLSESLLRASWSNSSLNSSEKDATAAGHSAWGAANGIVAGRSPPSATSWGRGKATAIGHKRTRHSTSPATHLRVQVSNVPFSHHIDRHDRDRDHSA